MEMLAKTTNPSCNKPEFSFKETETGARLCNRDRERAKKKKNECALVHSRLPWTPVAVGDFFEKEPQVSSFPVRFLRERHRHNEGV